MRVRPKLGEREVTFIHVTEWIEKKLQREFQVCRGGDSWALGHLEGAGSPGVWLERCRGGQHLQSLSGVPNEPQMGTIGPPGKPKNLEWSQVPGPCGVAGPFGGRPTRFVGLSSDS